MAAAVAMFQDVVFATENGHASEPSFSDLVHDLRQPLSSIEAIAYYLEMTIPAYQVEAREMLLKLQSIVEEAGSILERAEHPRPQ